MLEPPVYGLALALDLSWHFTNGRHFDLMLQGQSEFINFNDVIFITNHKTFKISMQVGVNARFKNQSLHCTAEITKIECRRISPKIYERHIQFVKISSTCRFVLMQAAEKGPCAARRYRKRGGLERENSHNRV